VVLVRPGVRRRVVERLGAAHERQFCELVAQELDVRVGRPPFAQPDPRLRHVRVGVEPLPSRTVPVPVRELVDVEHHVLLDRGDIGRGERPRLVSRAS